MVGTTLSDNVPSSIEPPGAIKTVLDLPTSAPWNLKDASVRQPPLLQRHPALLPGENEHGTGWPAHQPSSKANNNDKNVIRGKLPAFPGG